MKKKDADLLLRASKTLKVEMTIQGGTNDDYSVSFFHQSKLTYTKYLAARTFILSLELENDKPIG